MVTATRVQTLNKSIRISDSTNTLEKAMKPTVLPLALGKIVEQIGLFILRIKTDLGARKIWIQTC